MNILAIVGLAILTAVLATLMRRYHKEYAMLLSVLGGGHRLEKWFLSEWGQMLSRGHGDEIIERCKREVMD